MIKPLEKSEVLNNGHLLKISEFCKLVKGISPALKTPPGEYPLVVTSEERRSSNTFQFDTKAVCIPLVSSTGHGHASIKRIHYQEGKFALANILVALIPDENICLTKYLYHLLNFKKEQLIVPLMRGSANVSIKPKDITSIEIIIPDLVIQKNHLSIFEKLNYMESMQKDLFQLLLRLKKSINHNVMKNGINGVVGDNQFNFNGKIFTIPSNWKTDTLGNCLEIGLRNGIYKHAKFFDKGSAKIIELGNLYSSEREIDNRFLRKIEVTDEEITKYNLQNEDVIINRVSKKPEGIAQARIIKLGKDDRYPIIFESNMFRARLNKTKILPDFFNYYTQSSQYYDQVLSVCLTNNQTSINQSSLNSVIIPIPDPEEQKRICEFLLFVDNIIHKIKNISELIQNLRTTIYDGLLYPEI